MADCGIINKNNYTSLAVISCLCARPQRGIHCGFIERSDRVGSSVALEHSFGCLE